MHGPSESILEVPVIELKLPTARVMPSSAQSRLVCPLNDCSKLNVVAACVFDGASPTLGAMPRVVKRVRLFMMGDV